MSKPSDLHVLPTLIGLALLAPLCAFCGVSVGAPSPEPAPAPAPPVVQQRPQPPSGGYQIRCWQHGRLLFEENHITLPADGPRYGIRVSGTDRNGRPMYVAETSNATCLVRTAVDERYFPPR